MTPAVRWPLYRLCARRRHQCCQWGYREIRHVLALWATLGQAQRRVQHTTFENYSPAARDLLLICCTCSRPQLAHHVDLVIDRADFALETVTAAGLRRSGGSP